CLGAILPSVALADRAPEVLSPPGEKLVALFDGRDLSGWEGLVGKHWTVEDGTIRGANAGDVPASTYLFTKGKHRDFRLLLEVKQTRGDHFSPMHSAVAVLGEVLEDKGGPYGFKGPLVMFCNDWGVWDANRRNRVFPPRYPTNWRQPAEIVGDWNRIEVLVRGDHPFLRVKAPSIPPPRRSRRDGPLHPRAACRRWTVAIRMIRTRPSSLSWGSTTNGSPALAAVWRTSSPGVVKADVIRGPIA
ncbi:MAG: DUF1080 domain-containing protein, partial [Verrucomicrobiota bacterium]